MQRELGRYGEATLPPSSTLPTSVLPGVPYEAHAGLVIFWDFAAGLSRQVSQCTPYLTPTLTLTLALTLTLTLTLTQAIYAITDGIPFYNLGAVYQIISGVCGVDGACEVEYPEGTGPSDGASSADEPSDGTSDRAALGDYRAAMGTFEQARVRVMA